MQSSMALFESHAQIHHCVRIAIFITSLTIDLCDFSQQFVAILGDPYN